MTYKTDLIAMMFPIFFHDLLMMVFGSWPLVQLLLMEGCAVEKKK